MTETLAELAETDALLTALSHGDRARTGDPVLDALSGWVEEITSHPVRRVAMDLPELDVRAHGGRGWRIAATAVALTAMSSSGIAAAATGDPLAPFSYFATALGNLAPSDRADENGFGSRMPAGLEADSSSRESDHATGDAAALPFGAFSSAPAQGRHRSDAEGKPRHRADEAGRSDASSESATDAGYTPIHLAADDGSSTSDPVVVPAETPPVETPPVETPPVETPPAETPPTEPSDPQAPGADEPDPETGGDPVDESPTTADSAPTDSGSTGSDATVSDASSSTADDQTVVRVTADVAVEAPADESPA
jgi:hypothetical protein